MTVITRTVFRPLPGKTAQALGRIRRLGERISQFGGGVRVASVAWGDGAPDLHLYSVFETMQAGAKAATALAEDAETRKLRAEGEADPGSHWQGPEIWRNVYGEPRPDYPVILQREYSMDRRNLGRGIALLPEMQAILPNIPLLGVIPVFSGDMARVMVAYYAKSLVELGAAIDTIGMSEAFQAIVLRAAELGALTKSRVVTTI